ncbi:MAG: AraC family transcriptional regulator ligand-binding domain-containing protein, partial [Paracoccus sp. (in: a-proteobacteria)]
MERYYHRASSLMDLQDLAKAQGADIGSAMRAVGLSQSLLRRPDDRIDFAALCALLNHCAQAWAMPDLALRLASYQHLEILGPLGLVTRMARDLRGALTAIADNLDINSNAVVAQLSEEDRVATLIVDTLVQPPGTPHFILLSLGLARNVIEAVSNGPLDLIEVSLRQDTSDLRAGAERWFRCPVRFHAEQNALYFESAPLDRLIARSDEAYRAIVERYFAATRMEATESIAGAARQEIARQMEFGICTLESLCLRMRIEPRSMQRRLKEEGTSFRNLVDDWRRERALSLVTQTRLPLSEVTLALGFT